jgi:hypothetical protein
VTGANARGVLLALLVLAVGPAVARADYTGSVNTSTDTVTLTGSGDVQLSTSGGLLHHNDLGSGFSDGIDFDSTQSGDQTVPDAAGWTIDITGGGSDTLEMDEGEATDPVTYEFGHNFYPGGTPCLYRAPEAFPGITMDPEPDQNLTVCYTSGFGSVTVRPGAGSIQYGVLDTQAGVPLYLYGGAGGADQMNESADVPTSVGGYHNAASPVYFHGGSGAATVAYIDDVGSTAATYTVGSGVISKTGQYPLYYSLPNNPASSIQLYPQQGPSTINVGSSGGVLVQIFGNFFGQTGPDVINGSKADAPMVVTGSLGNDTITTSPVAGGGYFGGGGDPTIYATDSSSTTIDCNQGGPPKGTVYAAKGKDQISDCAHVVYLTTKLTLSRLSFKSSRVKAGSKLTLRTPSIAAGKLALTFELNRCSGKGHERKCRYHTVGTRSFSVKAGSSSITFSSQAQEGSHHRLKKLSKDTYRVAVMETSGSLRSSPVDLKLTIR